MTTSAIPAVLGYLFDTCSAASNLGASTTTPLTVYYCNAVSADFQSRSLWIGMGDPDAQTAVQGATSTQNWTGPGSRLRDEHLTIPCMVQVYTGDEKDIRRTIEDCFSILSAVEDLVRGQANLGGNVLYTSPGVNNIALRHGEAVAGFMVQILFDIEAFARIGA